MSRLVTCVWDVLCCGVFCAMGRVVPWDLLCCGTFCAMGRLEMGRFESRTFSAVGRLVPWDVW
jgi:hypothetical protein